MSARDGKITAINTKYPSGQPIAPERVDRILGKSFAGHDIIQKCIRDTTDDEALEFQTKCDITPALFDSSGLSIAYSVAVKDEATGAKIGVTSSRLCFKRLTDLIAYHGSDVRKYSIDFINDQGSYFSEEINGGLAAPPIAPRQLAKIVEPLVAGKTKATFSRLGDKYLLVFRLNDFTTVDGGGLQVMVTANESWLAGEARHIRELESAERAAIGLLFLCFAALTFAITQLRRSQRRLRQDLGERRKANTLLQREIEERVSAERKAESIHEQLMQASRRSGMAEVAVGVLHNVGNVLNSVNVGAGLVVEKLRHFRVDQLARVAGAIEQHRADLGHYLTQDPKGKHVPDFLTLLAGHLTEERGELLDEVARLANKVDHIKTIVAAQHSYAGTSGMIEPVDVAVLLDDAIKMNTSSFERHMVRVEHQYADLPVLLLDKQRLLQILVNLVKNAKEAMVETESSDRRLTIETRFAASNRFRIIVRDTGVGISPENLTRIFTYGFTTKKTGHGFGLHSCANAAKEMSGSLTAESDGPRTGATFTLELPLKPADEHVWAAGEASSILSVAV